MTRRNADNSGHQRGTAPLDEAESGYYDILQLSPEAYPDTIHRVYRLPGSEAACICAVALDR